ncbi:N-acetylmuramoyl-L-alanine amidase [Streptomyces sp. NPDC002004]
MEHSLLSRRGFLRGAACAAGGAVAGLAVTSSAGCAAGSGDGGHARAVTKGEAGAAAHPEAGTGHADTPEAAYPTMDYSSALWLPADPTNYTPSSRPEAYPVDFVVIHLTTATFPGTIATFQDPGEVISAHYVVRAYDGRIAQCVRERDIALHAGNWDYNTRSIGIEHEGWMEQRTYSEPMYRASATLTASLCRKYGIPVDRDHIIGHVEVPEATHEDPGTTWDWGRYMKLVEAA